jgi:rare lipoprotein A
MQRTAGVRQLHRPGWYLAVCILVASCLSACAPGPPQSLPAPPPGKPPPSPAQVQYGLASWYGHELHGRRTASGEPFDMYQLTAAHRTAPFGTYAVVTNLDNGQQVRVRINDRGPSRANRLMDLSYEAARQLAMVRAGTARVKVEFDGVVQ